MKYRNKKTIIDGIQFDSKKESERYLILKKELKDGLIRDLELQPKFLLQEGFTHLLTGKKHRPITYSADFRYTQGEIDVVEDVKGMKTEAYKLKKKMLLKNHPFIYFQEI